MAISERRGSSRASGRSSMSTRVTSCVGSERGGGLGADQPSSDHDNPPAGTAQAPVEREEARCRRVLLGRLEAGNRRPRVAKARRPDERRGLDLTNLGTVGRAHQESARGQVACGHDSVDALDASLLELRRICEQRHAARQERPLRERRAVVRQSRPDHRHRHAPLGQPGGTGVTRDSVPDNDYLTAHARRKACTEESCVRRELPSWAGNPHTAPVRLLAAERPQMPCATARIRLAATAVMLASCPKLQSLERLPKARVVASSSRSRLPWPQLR